MSGIAESYDNSMFNFLKTRQTFKTLDSGCASCVGQDSRMGLLFARDDIKIACKNKAVVLGLPTPPIAIIGWTPLSYIPVAQGC